MIDVIRCKCGCNAKMVSVKRKTGNGLKKFYSINCNACKRHTHFHASKNLARRDWLALIK